MLKTELKSSNKLLKNIINKFPSIISFYLNGTYKLITPSQWKNTCQYNIDQQLLFIKNGKGKYIFNDETLDLYRGMIIYISDHCDYQVINDEKDPLEIISIKFDIKDNKTYKNISVKNPFKVIFMPDDILKLGIKFHKFYEDINSNVFKDIKVAITNSFISEMLIEIYKYTRILIVESIDERVNEGKRIIEISKHKNISIKEISNQVGISARYFRKLFKSAYGVSPKKYHLKVRMNYARFLLLEAKFTIKQTAYEVGYSDIYTFSRQYKEFFGFSPSSTNSK